MGSFVPFDDDLPFEEKVKCFADDELLEIWAESQEMQNMMQMNFPPDLLDGAYFEQAIIHELTVRLGKKLIRPKTRDFQA